MVQPWGFLCRGQGAAGLEHWVSKGESLARGLAHLVPRVWTRLRGPGFVSDVAAAEQTVWLEVPAYLLCALTQRGVTSPFLGWLSTWSSTPFVVSFCRQRLPVL